LKFHLKLNVKKSPYTQSLSRKILGDGTARGTDRRSWGQTTIKTTLPNGYVRLLWRKLEMRGGKKNLKGSLKIRANNGEEKTAASSYEMEMQGVRGEWTRSPTQQGKKSRRGRWQQNGKVGRRANISTG
jgi:hypothetical protein